MTIIRRICVTLWSQPSPPTHTHKNTTKSANVNNYPGTCPAGCSPPSPIHHILSLCLGPGNCAGTLCTCACRHLWQRQWRHFRLPPESMQHTICQANFVVQDMRFATQVTAGQQPLPLLLSLLQLLSACFAICDTRV